MTECNKNMYYIWKDHYDPLAGIGIYYAIEVERPDKLETEFIYGSEDINQIAIRLTLMGLYFPYGLDEIVNGKFKRYNLEEI